MRPAVLVLLATLAACATRGASLRFFLGNRERVCFGLSARPGALLHGYANLENGPGSAQLAVEVKGPDGAMIYEQHAVTVGPFSATTPATKASKAYGNDPYDDWDDAWDDDESAYGEYDRKYEACLLLTFDHDSDPQHNLRRAVTFRLHPADRPDGSGNVARQAGNSSGKMADVTSALKIMMRELQGMVSDLAALQRREHTLVKRNRGTARRLTILTCASIVVLVLTSLFQYSHYKSYFASKKLC